MRFSIARHITTADIISLTAALLGFISFVLVVLGQPLLAAGAIFVAAILDYIDGRVARRLGGSREWGKQIDSLCDTVAFGMAPAFLAWPVILYGAAPAGLQLALVASIFFPALIVLAGILRLARYNTTHIHGLYVGMPITMNGIIFPLVWVATLGLTLDMRASIMAATCVGSAILMVSDFIIRKR